MRLTAPWLTAAPTRAVMAALGGDALFVGGAVRNSLLRAPVSDIDLATPLLPAEVIARAEATGLKAVPTGIDHGTVTLIADHQAFEVTTYRADVETDGRRAVVRFSGDIAEDARRRDFTMNALYAKADGTLVDPLGGLSDLTQRRVRFILDAETRIREDALRILRFFRFTAWYGAEIDAEGLAASAALAALVDSLARERIGAEMRKLLVAPDPAPATASMAASGVLGRVLPGAEARALGPLVAAEAAAGALPDWRTRLCALGGEGAVARLRLSKAEARALEDIRRAQDLSPAIGAAEWGADAAQAAALIRASLMPEPWPPIAAEIARGGAARFPLTAQDLIEAGWTPGPALGDALATARKAWLQSDLSLTREALLAHLRA
ncbi:MAG: CCA tRNA nucleotidyltransferase [Pseudomonadota bacterium]